MRNTKLLCTLGVASLVACETSTTAPPPDQRVARTISAQEVADTITNDSKTLALGVMRAAQKFENLELVDALALGEFLRPLTGACDQPEPCNDLEAEAGEFAEGIAEVLFDSKLVESTEATKIVYKLDPATVCPRTATDIAPKPIDPNDPNAPTEPPPSEPEPDADCVAHLSAHPIRLETQSFETGALTIRILVDTTSAEVAKLDLTAARIDLSVSLDALHGFLTGLELGDDLALDQIQRMAGRVSMTLAETAPLDYLLSLKIDAPIEVQIAGDEPIAFALEGSAAAPLIAFRANGNTETVTLSHELGRIAATLPLALLAGEETVCSFEAPTDPEQPPPEPVCTTKERHGSIDLALGHLKGTAELTGDQERIHARIEAQGADLATARFGTAKLAGLDLNAGGPSAFELDVTATDDRLDLAVTPSLSAGIFLDLRSLADQLEVPSWASGETLSGALEAATLRFAPSQSDAPPARPGSDVPPPEPTEPAPMRLVEVIAGNLSLSATSLAAPISVAAGQCLLERPEGSESGHPFAALMAGACN